MSIVPIKREVLRAGHLQVPHTSTEPALTSHFPLFSTRRREELLHFLLQHHGQRSSSPPRGHLLLRLPVARSCRGLLSGDALGGFPPEDPAGERPGETF